MSDEVTDQTRKRHTNDLLVVKNKMTAHMVETICGLLCNFNFKFAPVEMGYDRVFA